MKRFGANPLTRRISDRVFELLNKKGNSNVVDLTALRQATLDHDEMTRRLLGNAAEYQAAMEDSIPWQVQQELDVIQFVMALGAGLLELDAMSKHRDMIAISEDDYLPGGPPQSPILDSFFGLWGFFDLQFGRFRETVASVVLDIARKMSGRGSENPLLDRLQQIVGAQLRIVTCEATISASTSRVKDVISGELFDVVHAPDLTVVPGEMLLWRLTPPFPGDIWWVGVASVYVIVNTSAAQWQAYVQRHSEPGQTLVQAYPSVMRPREDAIVWLEYVFEGYYDFRGGRVYITGIPDLPQTLPHSPEFDDDERDFEERGATEGIHEYVLRMSAFAGQELGRYLREQSWSAEIVANSIDRVVAGVNVEHIRNGLVIPLMLYTIRYRGETPAARFLATKPSLPSDVVEYMHASVDQPASLYEIISVDRGKGVELLDLIRGGKSFVYERLGSEKLHPRELVLARVVTYQGHRTIDGLFPSVLPPSARESVLAAFNERLARAAGKTMGDKLGDATMDLVEIFQGIRDMATERGKIESGNPKTPGGDKLVLCTTTYRFEKGDRKAILHKLEEVEGFELQPREGKVRTRNFVWRWDDQPDAIRGQIEVRDTKLEVRSVSREDDLRMRKQLTELLGTMMHHEKSEEQQPQEVFSSLQAESPMAAFDELDDDARAAIAQILSKQYASFLDQSIPALGNQSPRQCARTPAGRKQVDQFLRNHEHGLSRQGLSGIVDFEGWRRELGIGLESGSQL